MFRDHWSSCALHSGPARWPMSCDCGGFRGDTQSDLASDHSDCSRGAVLRNFVQLWKARLVWIRENHEIPARCRLKAAMHRALGRRHDHSQPYEAPPL